MKKGSSSTSLISIKNETNNAYKKPLQPQQQQQNYLMKTKSGKSIKKSQESESSSLETTQQIKAERDNAVATMSTISQTNTDKSLLMSFNENGLGSRELEEDLKKTVTVVREKKNPKVVDEHRENSKPKPKAKKSESSTLSLSRKAQSQQSQRIFKSKSKKVLLKNSDIDQQQSTKRYNPQSLSNKTEKERQSETQRMNVNVTFNKAEERESPEESLLTPTFLSENNNLHTPELSKLFSRIEKFHTTLSDLSLDNQHNWERELVNNSTDGRFEWVEEQFLILHTLNKSFKSVTSGNQNVCQQVPTSNPNGKTVRELLSKEQIIYYEEKLNTSGMILKNIQENLNTLSKMNLLKGYQSSSSENSGLSGQSSSRMMIQPEEQSVATYQEPHDDPATTTTTVKFAKFSTNNNNYNKQKHDNHLNEVQNSSSLSSSSSSSAWSSASEFSEKSRYFRKSINKDINFLSISKKAHEEAKIKSIDQISNSSEEEEKDNLHFLLDGRRRKSNNSHKNDDFVVVGNDNDKENQIRHSNANNNHSNATFVNKSNLIRNQKFQGQGGQRPNKVTVFTTATNHKTKIEQSELQPQIILEQSEHLIEDDDRSIARSCVTAKCDDLFGQYSSHQQSSQESSFVAAPSTEQTEEPTEQPLYLEYEQLLKNPLPQSQELISTSTAETTGKFIESLVKLHQRKQKIVQNEHKLKESQYLVTIREQAEELTEKNESLKQLLVENQEYYDRCEVQEKENLENLQEIKAKNAHLQDIQKELVELKNELKMARTREAELRETIKLERERTRKETAKLEEQEMYTEELSKQVEDLKQSLLQMEEKVQKVEKERQKVDEHPTNNHEKHQRPESYKVKYFRLMEEYEEFKEKAISEESYWKKICIGCKTEMKREEEQMRDIYDHHPYHYQQQPIIHNESISRLSNSPTVVATKERLNSNHHLEVSSSSALESYDKYSKAKELREIIKFHRAKLLQSDK